MIQLSDHFTYRKLLRFVLPSIIMMIFTSIYGVVDGFFVSNYVGAVPFAAINLIMPFLMVFGAIGFMLGTGGSALVAMFLGEDKKEKANETFSMIIYTIIIVGISFTIIGQIAIRPVSFLLGASEAMIEHCVAYGRIIICAITAFMLQNVFQSFLITAERPHLGLTVTVISGVTNMVLDWFFMAVLNMGVVGAATATAISQFIGGLIPLFYFCMPNRSTLHLGRARLDWQSLRKAASNGVSEFMSNISMSIVNILYNYQLMRIAGESGVAAYGVIMYVNFIFISVFFGYSMGCAPIVSYHYGAGNHSELKNVFRKSIKIIAGFSIVLVTMAEVMARPLSMVFVSYDAQLLEITTIGFMIYSVSYISVGINIFGSAFFTALNNGIVSAGISVVRTIVCQIIAVIVLPLFFGLNGVWMAIVVAETMAAVISVTCLIRYRKRYHY